MTLRSSLTGAILVAMLAVRVAEGSSALPAHIPKLQVTSIHLDSGLPAESETHREVSALMPISLRVTLGDIQNLADSIVGVYYLHGIHPVFVYIDVHYISKTAIELRVRVVPNREKRPAMEIHRNIRRSIDETPIKRRVADGAARVG